MKKLFATVLSLVLVLSLASCGKGSDKENGSNAGENASTEANNSGANVADNELLESLTAPYDVLDNTTNVTTPDGFLDFKGVNEGMSFSLCGLDFPEDPSGKSVIRLWFLCTYEGSEPTRPSFEVEPHLKQADQGLQFAFSEAPCYEEGYIYKSLVLPGVSFLTAVSYELVNTTDDITMELYTDTETVSATFNPSTVVTFTPSYHLEPIMDTAAYAPLGTVYESETGLTFTYTGAEIDAGDNIMGSNKGMVKIVRVYFDCTNTNEDGEIAPGCPFRPYQNGFELEAAKLNDSKVSTDGLADWKKLGAGESASYSATYVLQSSTSTIFMLAYDFDGNCYGSVYEIK